MKEYAPVRNLGDNEGCIYAETLSKFQRERMDESEIEFFVLRHGYDSKNLGHCGGTFERIGGPEHMRVLFCDRCKLEIRLPKGTALIGQLRKVTVVKVCGAPKEQV